MKTQKKIKAALTNAKTYRFQRFGKAYHLKIESATDLFNIADLDEAFWVATTAPIATINADAVFLRSLDSDRDGRVRAAELIDAIRWLFEILENTDGVNQGSTFISLADVSSASEDGRKIQATINKILQEKTLESGTDVSLQDVRRIIEREKETEFTEAGIILPKTVSEPKIKKFISDILATVGGVVHPSGKKGIDSKHLEKFLEEVRAYLNWITQTELPDDRESRISPHEEASARAYKLFSTLAPKIDHYFALCDAAHLDPDIVNLVKANELQLKEIDYTDTQAVITFLRDAPLALPRADQVLDFKNTINPYYAETVENFRTEALPQIFQNIPDALSKADWQIFKQELGPYHQWFDSRPDVSVGKLGNVLLREYLDDPTYAQEVRKLIEDSQKSAFVIDNLRLLEKLILFQANLLEFANSFVSFPHLYHPTERALFEMGTLVMDGRHFTLCVKVPDRAQHAQFSNASNMFVLYLEVIEAAKKLYEIAVPVTSGGKGNIQENKWGIFKHINGREYHARVVQIVENPISFSEAVAAPFNRLGHAISAKLEEMSTKASENLDTTGSKAVTELTKLPEKPIVASATSPEKPSGGMVAGGGIAIAAIGSSMAFITKTLAGLSWMAILGSLLVILMAVLIPTAIVAFLKLRKRDLSSILEGASWGTNTRMRLTLDQAKTFTHQPGFPPGSKGVHRRKWWVWLIGFGLVAAVAYWLMSNYL